MIHKYINSMIHWLLLNLGWLWSPPTQTLAVLLYNKYVMYGTVDFGWTSLPAKASMESA